MSTSRSTPIGAPSPADDKDDGLDRAAIEAVKKKAAEAAAKEAEKREIERQHAEKQAKERKASIKKNYTIFRKNLITYQNRVRVAASHLLSAFPELPPDEISEQKNEVDPADRKEQTEQKQQTKPPVDHITERYDIAAFGYLNNLIFHVLTMDDSDLFPVVNSAFLDLIELFLKMDKLMMSKDSITASGVYNYIVIDQPNSVTILSTPQDYVNALYTAGLINAVAEFIEAPRNNEKTTAFVNALSTVGKAINEKDQAYFFRKNSYLCSLIGTACTLVSIGGGFEIDYFYRNIPKEDGYIALLVFAALITSAASLTGGTLAGGLTISQMPNQKILLGTLGLPSLLFSMLSLAILFVPIESDQHSELVQLEKNNWFMFLAISTFLLPYFGMIYHSFLKQKPMTKADREMQNHFAKTEGSLLALKGTYERKDNEVTVSTNTAAFHRPRNKRWLPCFGRADGPSEPLMMRTPNMRNSSVNNG